MEPVAAAAAGPPFHLAWPVAVADVLPESGMFNTAPQLGHLPFFPALEAGTPSVFPQRLHGKRIVSAADEGVGRAGSAGLAATLAVGGDERPARDESGIRTFVLQ
jgi:hypothetical protein